MSRVSPTRDLSPTSLVTAIFLATYESLYISALKILIVLIRKLIIFTISISISISISIKSVCSFFTSMANHWNIRRRVVQHADKIEDSKEVLKTFLRRNNYSSKADINQLMSSLGETSVAHLDAAIQRTQNTVVISQTLLEVLKTEKKRKEELLKLHSYDDVAALRQQQKDARRLELDTKRNLTAWVLPVDGEEDMV